MTTNEPSTGEIVRALRGCAEGKPNCKECMFHSRDNANCLVRMLEAVSGHLESRERELARITDELLRKTQELEAMAARAESAEKTITALKCDLVQAKTHGACSTCESQKECAELNRECGGKMYRWRGKPQKGR